MNLKPWVNWMHRFTVYETQSDVYIVVSDDSEKFFRIMSISRKPMELEDPYSEPTLADETKYDLAWRLHLRTDSRVLNREKLARFLHSVKVQNSVLGLATHQSSVTNLSRIYAPHKISENYSFSVGGYQPLSKSLVGFGIVGFIRFLNGYYLIIVTQRSEVGLIGEHRIFKIDDTKMIYIPGINFHDNKSKTASDESRFLRMFQSVELSKDFYFSYTYDLTRSLQANMQSFELSEQFGPKAFAFRSIPDSRYMWNYSFIPPRFRPKNGAVSEWFLCLVHGFVKQAALISCGLPISITLIARRSRFFAGTRFLKRGTNIDGNVANEVETEQVVCDTAEPYLARMRVSSVVQCRGSVPLFWSQDTTGLVVGKPPLAITWQDPYYEAFGMHFAGLIKRHGAPVIVLNLMKQQEKRRFEQQLTDGFFEAVKYLNQYSPRPPASCSSKTQARDEECGGEEAWWPIAYVGFDIAKVKQRPHALALDRLREVAVESLHRTGIFFSSPGLLSPPSETYSKEDLMEYTRLHMGSDLCPRQQGVIRTNCVDCLDRTNIAQFVVGHVALAFQLRAIGLLDKSDITFESVISKLLQDLYEEHGNVLALQYGGSGVVHNIETYQNPSTPRVKSRDIMQTLSRYYSNNFIDFEKQLATDLFLRVYRPGAGPPISIDSVLPAGASEDDLRAAAAAVAAATSVAAGQSFMTSSDPAVEAYMHWLQAWSTLPPYRPPAGSAWFPEATAQRRWLGDWGGGASRCPASSPKFQFVELEEGDPAGDWFSELYQPHEWTHFQDLRFHQLPLASHGEAPQALRSTSVANAPLPTLPHTPLRETRSFSEPRSQGAASYSPSGLSSCSASAGSVIVRTPNPSDTSVASETSAGSSKSTAQASDQTSVIQKYLEERANALLTGTRPPAASMSLLPKAASSLRQAIAVASPLTARFAHIRLSELALRAQEACECDSTSTSTLGVGDHVSPLSGDVEEAEEVSLAGDDMTSVGGGLETHTGPPRFGLHAKNSPVKLRAPSKEDVEKYRSRSHDKRTPEYASLQFPVMNKPLSEVLAIDPISLKTYEHCMNLATSDNFAIRNESLQMYRKCADVKNCVAHCHLP